MYIEDITPSFTPNLPVESMKTYQLSAPITSHRRQADCAEAQCTAYQFGWKSGYDLSNPEIVKMVRWIRMHSGRTYTVEQVGTKLILTFPAGQRCFQKHTVPLEREPFYVVRGGDWRGNPRRERTVLNADDWVDDFATHQDILKTRLEQG